MDQNINSFDFDQTQPPQYPDIHHPSQEMSEKILQAKENLMKSIQTFLEKFNRISFGEMPKRNAEGFIASLGNIFEIQHAQPEDIHELLRKLLEDLKITIEELTEYINSLSWNSPTFFYDDDDYEYSIQYKEYLENSSNAITPVLPTEEPDNSLRHSIQYKEYLKNSSNAITTVLPTKEPKYSLSMRDEHLSTIPEMKSDKVIKSSVKNLVQIPSEYEVTSDNESECDVPVKDESSPIFTTFSNPIFDYNDDFTSSDDESFSNEDVSMEIFKIYLNPLFDDEGINSNKIDPHYFNVESDLIEYLSNRDILFDSYSKARRIYQSYGEVVNHQFISRPLENFHANTIIETLPKSPIPVEDSDSLREEIDIFTSTDDFMPPSIESDDYDSERDIHFFKELLSNDSISLPKNESSNFEHHDDPSFPRPPPEPPDVEIFFEPNLGVLTTNVVKGISEHYVLMSNFLPTLPTFDSLYPMYDIFLLFSSDNEDKVFKPGILSYLLASHQDKTISDFSENPMMMYGGDIPSKGVPDLHIIPMDK
nr:hypothetical protein [Tanacetum cinerariifolium]